MSSTEATSHQHFLHISSGYDNADNRNLNKQTLDDIIEDKQPQEKR